jgi:hypothetical protein
LTKKKSVTPAALEIAVAGDRRHTENLIVQVRAAARKFGLDVSGVHIVPKSSVRPKTPKQSRKSKKSD